MFVAGFLNLRHSYPNASFLSERTKEAQVRPTWESNTKCLCCAAAGSLSHSQTKAVLIDHNENKCSSQMVSLQEAGH